jgi:hypothetical protein
MMKSHDQVLVLFPREEFCFSFQEKMVDTGNVRGAPAGGVTLARLFCGRGGNSTYGGALLTGFSSDG